MDTVEDYLEFTGPTSLLDSLNNKVPVSKATVSDLQSLLKDKIKPARLAAVKVNVWKQVKKITTTYVWNGSSLLSKSSVPLNSIPGEKSLASLKHPLDGKIHLPIPGSWLNEPKSETQSEQSVIPVLPPPPVRQPRLPEVTTPTEVALEEKATPIVCPVPVPPVAQYQLVLSLLLSVL